MTAAVGYLLPEPQETVLRRILLDNAGGPVVFQHADHALQQKIPSRKCHHEQPEKSEYALRCKSCHGATMDEGFKKNHTTAFQGNETCAVCHHAELIPKDWGHKSHQE